MLPQRTLLMIVLLSLLLSACVTMVVVGVPEGESAATPTSRAPESTATATPFAPAENTLTPSAMPATSTGTPLPTATVPLLPMELALDPADWHNWPVIPIVTEKARFIYESGQALGNDPHAFSVLGDCQAEPNVFMGPYETIPTLAAGLTPELQETLAWFSGSFSRDGPTIRGGTTSGALLWSAWHQNKYTCTIYETPLQCELRIHKPSFVFVLVGTHYESHNDSYLREVVDQVMAAGVVPILFSKADNREQDELINLQAAQLAAEYDLPFWNFWVTLAELENRGLYTRKDVPLQGDIYLTEQALAIHRLTALQALDAVWRAVTGR